MAKTKTKAKTKAKPKAKRSIIRTSTEDDIKYVAKHLRKADKQELKALVGIDPYVALYMSAINSVEPMTWEFDGKPVMMWGACPLDETTGKAWAVGTDDIFKKDAKATFKRGCRKQLDKLHDNFELLVNVIDARNELHLQWLKDMDFKVIRKIDEMGVEQRPFYEFARIKNAE